MMGYAYLNDSTYLTRSGPAKMLPWLLLLLACAPDDGADGKAPSRPSGGGSDEGEDSAPIGGEDSATPIDGALLEADPLRLPVEEVGSSPPSVELILRNTGADAVGPLQWSVSEGFTLGGVATGEDSPLEAGEERSLELVYTGDMDEPVNLPGLLNLSLDDSLLSLDLAAVITGPDIPASTWTMDAWGQLTTLDLPSAPFAEPGAPYRDASVEIFLPTGWTGEEGIAVVTHFHGHNATIAEVDEAQHLHAQMSLSGRDAIFVLPQGPVEAADSDFGKLDEADGYAHLIRDVVAVLYRDGKTDRVDLGRQVLTSHSGGYNVTANVIEVGGLPIDGVHLFDSLYARADSFEEYALSGGVLRSVYTAGGGTDADNEALYEALDEAGGPSLCTGFDDEQLRDCLISIGYSSASHSGCVSEERAYGRWLAASGMGVLPAAPPLLLSVESDGTEAHLRWREEVLSSGVAPTIVVEGSEDGEDWAILATTDSTEATVPAMAWLRLRGTGSDPVTGASDLYAGSGDDWLVVDGFDRVFGGSWALPTHPLAARLASGLPGGASTAWHEAVAEGLVSLDDYPRVIWMLGDESSTDLTFDSRERAAIEAYLTAGGELIISGAEVGYATDSDWLEDTLHTSFVSDDAGSDEAASWSFGVLYEEDYPDVLSGEETLWSYSTGGGAAVGWNEQVIVVGFGLENLDEDDLAPALAELADWLE